MYLRTKNEDKAVMRLDATVKYIEVVEKSIFRTNGLIFGLCSTLMILMIVNILTVAAQLSMYPQAGLQLPTASPAA